MSGDNIIEVEAARFKMGKRQSLIVPRFCLPSGAIAVVLGPNGSGKSTFARRLCGISGSDRLEALRWRIPKPAPTMIWQTLNLFPTTVEQNVRIVAEAEVEPSLKYFGLWLYRTYNIDYLSGGEKQKLAIARSFAAASNVVVMDEPTSSLDGQAIANLIELIAVHTGRARETEREAWIGGMRDKSTPGSVVVITHDIRLVRDLSHLSYTRVYSITHDRTFALETPRFLFNGNEAGEGFSIEELYKNPADLFIADFFGIPNVVGFAGAEGRPRGAQDLCSRHSSRAQGWIIIRDTALHAMNYAQRDQTKHGLAGRYLGTEISSTQMRVRVGMSGSFGEFELTLPMDRYSGAHDRDGGVWVNIDVEDRDKYTLMQPQFAPTIEEDGSKLQVVR